MTDRFYVDACVVQGQAGIFDQARGHRMICYFLVDPQDPEAAPRMARDYCATLNATVVNRQGGDHAL